MTKYTQTPFETLMQLDGVSESFYSGDHYMIAGPGRGVYACDPSFVEPLIEAGMAEAYGGDNPFYRLTEKGKAAVRLAKGEIKHAPYRMPDWFLEEVTRAEYTYGDHKTAPIPTTVKKGRP